MKDIEKLGPSHASSPKPSQPRSASSMGGNASGNEQQRMAAARRIIALTWLLGGIVGAVSAGLWALDHRGWAFGAGISGLLAALVIIRFDGRRK